MTTEYLILGASHAGLAALDAIKRFDETARVTLATAEDGPLYSPTALPYLISGKTQADQVELRSRDAIEALGVTFKTGAKASGLDLEKQRVTFQDGSQLNYDKLLVTTGASATLPPIPGLAESKAFSIRTLADADAIRYQAKAAKTAIILGAGYVGMHAAENLANAGLSVIVVELCHHIMPASFDPDAADRIADTFSKEGISLLTGAEAAQVGQDGKQTLLFLKDDTTLTADMLVVAAGIRPNTAFMAGCELDVTEGIPVDRRMRTPLANIWAAGDVALAPDFFTKEYALGGTIPLASDQGRIAGMDMVEDDYLEEYTGNLNMNTFGFFGNFAFSIGNIAAPGPDAQVHVLDPGKEAGKDDRFCKLVVQDHCLTGVSAVNWPLDPGVLREMIQTRTDLSDHINELLQHPRQTARRLIQG